MLIHMSIENRKWLAQIMRELKPKIKYESDHGFV